MIAAPAPLTLVFRSDSHICALPLSQVVEILRPLTVKPIADAPAAVQGLSVIRGQAVPVVDMAVLLMGSSGLRGRWIVVRTGKRRVALSVESVLGIREFRGSDWSELPPLIGDAGGAFIDAVAALDEELLLVLKSGGLVPDSVWNALPLAEA